MLSFLPHTLSLCLDLLQHQLRLPYLLLIRLYLLLAKVNLAYLTLKFPYLCLLFLQQYMQSVSFWLDGSDGLFQLADLCNLAVDLLNVQILILLLLFQLAAHLDTQVACQWTFGWIHPLVTDYLLLLCGYLFTQRFYLSLVVSLWVIEVFSPLAPLIGVYRKVLTVTMLHYMLFLLLLLLSLLFSLLNCSLQAFNDLLVVSALVL